MKKILLVMTALLLVTSCINDTLLSSKITAEIIQTKNLELSKYNDFDWESLIILQPYKNVEKVATEKHLNLGNVSNSIESSDDFNLLIFLKDDKAVKSCKLKRQFGDFNNFYNQIIPKNKANFNLTGDIYPKIPARLILK